MAVMSNTLLNPRMILAKAMVLVERAAHNYDESFEITIDLVYSSAALTYAIDAFAERYLQPAVDTAMERKLPLAEWCEFECTSPGADMEVCQTSAAIAGRLVRQYDINNDVMLTRIEMRVPDGTTRREALLLLQESWERRRVAVNPYDRN